MAIIRNVENGGARQVNKGYRREIERSSWKFESIVKLRATSRRDEIKLWSRNQSWLRGATNFILANISWPRALMDIILEGHKKSVCASDEIRSSASECNME